jgi:dTDP-4-amino-4,6-dideoxygalactose transaminase
VRPDVRHGFHLFVVRTKRRDALREYLTRKEIETGIHYPIALPKLAAYSHLGHYDPTWVANVQDESLLSLPIGEHLSNDDVDVVIDAVRAFAKASNKGIATTV